MRYCNRNHIVRSAITLFMISSASGLLAAQLQWVGNTDANWANTANWSPAQAPAAGDVLVFDSAGTAGSSLLNNLSPTVLDSLIILSNAATTWNFSGNAIVYTNSILCSNLNGLTINNDLVVGSDVHTSRIHVDAGGFIDLVGVVSDEGAGRPFRVQGNGLVTLVASNTFSGGLQLWGGYVRMDSGPENLGLGTNILVGGNSVSDFVDYTGDASINVTPLTNRLDQYQFTIAADSQLNIRALTGEIFDARLTGEGSVRFGTSGALGEAGPIHFSGTDNDFTGDFLYGFGTMRYNSVADPGQPSSLGSGTNLQVFNSLSGARWRYRGEQASSTTRTLTWTNRTGDLALDNDATDPTHTLKFLASNVVTWVGRENVPGDGNTTEFSLRGANDGMNEWAQSLNDDPINGNQLMVQKRDGGRWILSGSNTFTRGLRLRGNNAGTAAFTGPHALPSYSTPGAIIVDSQADADDEAVVSLWVGGPGWSSGEVDSLVGALNVQANSSTAVGLNTINGDFTYGTAISKTMGLTKRGANTLTLTAANTHNGSTRVKEGVLLVNGSTASAVAGRQINGASMILYYHPSTGGATLGGSGSVGGVTYVRRGARIQGGDANFSGTLTLGGLILGNANEDDWSRLRFNIAAGGQIDTTSFAVNGTNHVVQILDPTLTVGTNTLITYTGGSVIGSNGFGGLRLDENGLPAGVTANLLDTGSEIQLAVSDVPVVEPPVLDYIQLGGGVTELSWTGPFKLQSQTNLLSVGLSTNWVDYPDASNPVNVTNDSANPTVFFRLISLP